MCDGISLLPILRLPRPLSPNRDGGKGKSFLHVHLLVHRTWKLINETVDVDGNKVVIVNPIEPKQYVYSYECVSPCTACKGTYYSAHPVFFFFLFFVLLV